MLINNTCDYYVKVYTNLQLLSFKPRFRKFKCPMPLQCGNIHNCTNYSCENQLFLSNKHWQEGSLTSSHSADSLRSTSVQQKSCLQTIPRQSCLATVLPYTAFFRDAVACVHHPSQQHGRRPNLRRATWQSRTGTRSQSGKIWAFREMFINVFCQTDYRHWIIVHSDTTLRRIK